MLFRSECKRHPYSDLYEKLMNDKQCFGHGDYRVSPLSIEAATALSKLAQKVDSQTWRIERLEKALKPFAEVAKAMDEKYGEWRESDRGDVAAYLFAMRDLCAARAVLENK